MPILFSCACLSREWQKIKNNDCVARMEFKSISMRITWYFCLDWIWVISMNVIVQFWIKFWRNSNQIWLVTTIEKKPKLLKRPKSQTHPLSIEIPSRPPHISCSRLRWVDPNKTSKDGSRDAVMGAARCIAWLLVGKSVGASVGVDVSDVGGVDKHLVEK